jgi:hypothetical protein
MERISAPGSVISASVERSDDGGLNHWSPIGPAQNLFLREGVLPVVSPGLHAPEDRRVGSEVLLHGAPAIVLDRGAPLDAAGDRCGSSIRGVLEGDPEQRARCPCIRELTRITIMGRAKGMRGSSISWGRRHTA